MLGEGILKHSSIKGTCSYAIYNLNEEIRMNSSSGGIFYSFAKKVIDEGGTVFGATFDKNGEVYHKCCRTLNQVIDLMQSKYVQSDMKGCYMQIEAALLNREKVLFCGTPCQVQGVLSYLNVKLNKSFNDYRKYLITMDLICHGVPSRMIWRKYLKEISLGKKIQHINFRDKTNGWRNFSLKIDYEDGTYYLKSWLKDPYVQGFINNLYLRQSCYECKFRGIDRKSDFTMADFWGVHNVLPEMFDDKGTSILMVHNNYAKDILMSLEKEFCVCEISNETVATKNASVISSFQRNPKRIVFFNNVNNNDQGILSQKIINALKVPFIIRLKRKFKRILDF